jgi:CheY-like chemotaxis protein
MAPDILILDIQMPQMTGLEVLHHLQALPITVQVVVLSAHEGDYANQALARGATAFVPKGDISRLLNTLLGFINGGASP